MHTRNHHDKEALNDLIVSAEKRSVLTTEACYWLAIIVLRTGATNLADLGTRDFKLGYPLTLPGFATPLILVPQ
jgi:hypothetical protein